MKNKPKDENFIRRLAGNAPDLDHQIKSPLAAIKLGISILNKSARGDDAAVLTIMSEKLNELERVLRTLLQAWKSDPSRPLGEISAGRQTTRKGKK